MTKDYEQLLSRDDFREQVFQRDNGLCVICGMPAKDAHHIMERRLFSDGGYYIDNGASLCEEHHLEAEMTILSCDDIREAAGIPEKVLPEHLYPDVEYDKWGNIILGENTRSPGELFFDVSVQKILKQGGILDQFLPYVKYPRTLHLPWSPGVSKDDRVLEDLSVFENNHVVVTAKMDGENTTLYKDYLHARSLSSRDHVSRHWIKNFHSQIAYNIPNGWRICVENLWAKHTIHYKHLSNFCLLFSIWTEDNICLPWDDTVEWSQLLGVSTVPVLYKGLWDEELIRELYTEELNGDRMEGYVVRVVDAFHYGEFRTHVAKYVDADFRRDLNDNHGHWFHSQIEKNELEGK